jgi:hypothetical protein
LVFVRWDWFRRCDADGGLDERAFDLAEIWLAGADFEFADAPLLPLSPSLSLIVTTTAQSCSKISPNSSKSNEKRAFVAGCGGTMYLTALATDNFSSANEDEGEGGCSDNENHGCGTIVWKRILFELQSACRPKRSCELQIPQQDS